MLVLLLMLPTSAVFADEAIADISTISVSNADAVVTTVEATNVETIDAETTNDTNNTDTGLTEDEISILRSELTEILGGIYPELDSNTVGRELDLIIENLRESRNWAWPTESKDISYGFGTRLHPVYGYYKFHNGLDILGNYNSEIVAIRDGKVTLAGWFSGYGNTVIIAHDDGFTSLYGHGSEVIATVGEEVKKGEVVLLMGSTGVSSATHLHLSLSLNGEWIDPLSYLHSAYKQENFYKN